MSNVTLPMAVAALTDGNGAATSPYYRFFHQTTLQLASVADDVANIKLNMPVSSGLSANANVVGDNRTINTQGTLKNGIVVVSLADLADSGAGTLLAITRDAQGRISGSRSATITGTAGRVTIANGNASAGLPTIDLATVADAGGGALLRFVRDVWGRITGTSAATTSDLAEGTNLYYTDVRADARITAQKGVANGLAPLGSDTKINVTYLPAAVLGQVSYQGTWDASLGTPPTTTPSKGWYYIVTVAGSTSLGGITSWNVGDWAIYDTAWDKVDNTDAISSWNGRTGVVVPATGDYTFAQIGSTPTTLAGYGIVDAMPKSGGAFTGAVTGTSAAFTGPIASTTSKTSGYTVATLPAGTIGMRAYVTDALAPSFGAALVGGGAVVTPAFYNGTTWIDG